MHRFIYGIEYGQEMRLKNLEHHRFCHNHYSNVREQGRGQPHCRKLHLFTPSFQVTGSFSPTALNRTKNSNVLRRIASSQSLPDHFRYAPREHTTFLHPYTTNNACSIRRGGCHECSFTSVAESHFRVRIVLKKKIAKISVSLDGTLEDGLHAMRQPQNREIPKSQPSRTPCNCRNRAIAEVELGSTFAMRQAIWRTMLAFSTAKLYKGCTF